MSEEQHVALPHLYGAPAYSRPPRPIETIPRPFDPDELPIEADRTDDDALLLAEVTGSAWTAPVPVKAKPARRLRIGRAVQEATVTLDESAAAFEGASAPASAVPASAVPASGVPVSGAPASGSTDGTGGIQGRPFSLRGIGRIFGGDQK